MTLLVLILLGGGLSSAADPCDEAIEAMAQPEYRVQGLEILNAIAENLAGDPYGYGRHVSARSSGTRPRGFAVFEDGVLASYFKSPNNPRERAQVLAQVLDIPEGAAMAAIIYYDLVKDFPMYSLARAQAAQTAVQHFPLPVSGSSGPREGLWIADQWTHIFRRHSGTARQVENFMAGRMPTATPPDVFKDWAWWRDIYAAVERIRTMDEISEAGTPENWVSHHEGRLWQLFGAFAEREYAKALPNHWHVLPGPELRIGNERHADGLLVSWSHEGNQPVICIEGLLEAKASLVGLGAAESQYPRFLQELLTRYSSIAVFGQNLDLDRVRVRMKSGCRPISEVRRENQGWGYVTQELIDKMPTDFFQILLPQGERPKDTYVLRGVIYHLPITRQQLRDNFSRFVSRHLHPELSPGEISNQLFSSDSGRFRAEWAKFMEPVAIHERNRNCQITDVTDPTLLTFRNPQVGLLQHLRQRPGKFNLEFGARDVFAEIASTLPTEVRYAALEELERLGWKPNDGKNASVSDEAATRIIIAARIVAQKYHQSNPQSLEPLNIERVHRWGEFQPLIGRTGGLFKEYRINDLFVHETNKAPYGLRDQMLCLAARSDERVRTEVLAEILALPWVRFDGERVNIPHVDLKVIRALRIIAKHHNRVANGNSVSLDTIHENRGFWEQWKAKPLPDSEFWKFREPGNGGLLPLRHALKAHQGDFTNELVLIAQRKLSDFEVELVKSKIETLKLTADDFENASFDDAAADKLIELVDMMYRLHAPSHDESIRGRAGVTEKQLRSILTVPAFLILYNGPIS